MADYLQELRRSIDDRKKRTAVLKPSAKAAQEQQYGMTDGGGKARTAASTAVKPTTALTGQQSTAIVKPSVQAAREKQYGMTDGGGKTRTAVSTAVQNRTGQTSVIKPSAKAAQEQQYGIVDWKNTKPQTAVKLEAAALVSARPEEKPEKQNWAKTVLDVVDRGAGYAGQGISTAIDVAANALPIVEGWIFGVDKDATFTGQVLRPITYLAGKHADWVREYNAATQARIENDTRDSRAAQIAADIGSGVAGALPSAVAAILSGGSSTVAQLGTQATGISGTAVNAANTMLHNPVVQYNFAASLGNEFNAAKASGASDMDAMTAATVSGLFNAIVESGGVEALPKQLQGTDLSTAQKAWRWMISAVSEGGEEPIQGLISEMTAKAAYAANKPYFSTTDENAVVNPGRMVREFGYGTAIGGITGAVPMASKKAVELWERSKRENVGRAQVQNILEVQQNETAPDKETGANTMLSKGDLDEYLAVGTREHVRNAKREQLQYGGSPILTNVKEVREFIKAAINGKVPNTIKGYGKVGKNMAADIAAESNGTIDVDGYYLELDSNRLAHLSDHIKDDGDPRNIPLTEEQAMSLTEYIDNYDDVLGAVTKKDGSTRIILGKRINGHAVIVVLVSKGRSSIQPVTAWQNETSHYQQKYKKVGAHTTSQTANKTADSGYTHTPNLIIAEEVGVVNRGDSANGNNFAMGVVSSGKSNGTDEGIYPEYIRQLREVQEKVRAEELRQAYLRNMARLEEAEREAELDAAFWKGFDR